MYCVGGFLLWFEFESWFYFVWYQWMFFCAVSDVGAVVGFDGWGEIYFDVGVVEVFLLICEKILGVW